MATLLVIPKVNDDEETLQGIANRIATELGKQVPWHVTAYYPAYRFTHPPTPIDTLERAWNIGKAAGLEFVYVGNVPGHPYDHTYCPHCFALLIQRYGFEIIQNKLRCGCCPQCHRPIAGRWGGNYGVF